MAFPAVLEAANSNAALLVMLALPAELESPNSNETLLVMLALPAELESLKVTDEGNPGRPLMMVALSAELKLLKFTCAKMALLMVAVPAELLPLKSMIPRVLTMFAAPAVLVSLNISVGGCVPGTATRRSILMEALAAVLLLRNDNSALFSVSENLGTLEELLRMPAPVNVTLFGRPGTSKLKE
jgi:hypothetical protein